MNFTLFLSIKWLNWSELLLTWSKLQTESEESEKKLDRERERESEWDSEREREREWDREERDGVR